MNMSLEMMERAAQDMMQATVDRLLLEFKYLGETNESAKSGAVDRPAANGGNDHPAFAGRVGNVNHLD